MILLAFFSMMILLGATHATALGFHPSEIKSCDPLNLKSCFEKTHRDPVTGVFEVAKSFELVHKKDSEKIIQDKAVVLVHGLLDSPYYLKDVARVLYSHGYNVIVVRLSGHGTRPEDLLRIKLQDWRDDLSIAITYAHTLGRKLSIGGFSTGGALAMDAAFKDPNMKELFLFSPAVQLRNPLALFSCLANWFGMKWSDRRSPEDNPVNYRNTPVNAVCQLNKLIFSISNFYFWSDLRKLSIPVFMAYTLDDNIISPNTLNAVALNFAHKKSLAVVFASQSSCKNCEKIRERYGKSFYINQDPVSHGELPLKSNDYYMETSTQRYQFNRHFSDLEKDLSQFIIEQSFSTSH